jgi:hypothetical protein
VVGCHGITALFASRGDPCSSRHLAAISKVLEKCWDVPTGVCYCFSSLPVTLGRIAGVAECRVLAGGSWWRGCQGATAIAGSYSRRFVY